MNLNHVAAHQKSEDEAHRQPAHRLKQARPQLFEVLPEGHGALAEDFVFYRLSWHKSR